MSKVVKTCSSCPAAAAAEKATAPKANKIKFVLENTLPTSSDSTIKVKNFKKFLDYDVKTLNITGELQTYIHKNGFTHIKMAVTYQDKTTNKVNYLELDFLDNTKNEENRRFAFCACDSGCNDGNCFGGVVSGATSGQSLGTNSSKGLALTLGSSAALKLSGGVSGTVTIAPTL
jgi:hypothetical protein